MAALFEIFDEGDDKRALREERAGEPDDECVGRLREGEIEIGFGDER
jgi:hypothetical protein